MRQTAAPRGTPFPSDAKQQAGGLHGLRGVRAALLAASVFTASSASDVHGQGGDPTKTPKKDPPQPVRVDPALTKTELHNRGVFAHVSAYETSRTRRSEVPALLHAAIEHSRNNPSISAIELLKELNRSQLHVETARHKAVTSGQPFTGRNLESSLLEVSKAFPDPRVSFPAAILKEIRAVTNPSAAHDAAVIDRRVGQDHLSYYNRKHGVFNTDKTWRDIWDYGRQNPEYQQATAMFLEALLNTSPIASAKDNLAKHPDFRDVNLRLAKILKDGAATKEELKAIIQNQERVLSADLRRLASDVTTLVKDQEARRLSERTLEEEQRRIDMTTATIGLIGHSIRLFGGSQMADTATKFEGLATAAVKLHDALHTFSKDLTAAGGLIFAGNVVGIVSSVASIFSGGPSADQLILEQLGELRKDVKALREEMREHFRVVDAKLDMIFAAVVNNFDALHRTLAEQGKALAEIKEEVGRISTDISKLSDQLTGMDANVHAYILAAAERREVEQKKKFIEYEQRFNGPIPIDLWGEALPVIAAWGLNHAADDLSTGAPPTEAELRSDAFLADKLAKGRASKHLNLLARVMKVRFDYDILEGNGANLPDAALWLRACDYYLQMVDMAPEHLHSIKPKDLQDLRANGVRLADAMKRIKLQRTDSGVRVNDGMFTQLVANYEARLKGVFDALAVVDKNLDLDVTGGVLAAKAAGKALPLVVPPILTYNGQNFNRPKAFEALVPAEITYLYHLDRARKGPLTLSFDLLPKTSSIGIETKTTTVLRTMRESPGFGHFYKHEWIRDFEKFGSRFYPRVHFNNQPKFEGDSHFPPYFALGVIAGKNEYLETTEGTVKAANEERIPLKRGDDFEAVLKQTFPNAIVNKDAETIYKEQSAKLPPTKDLYQRDWPALVEAPSADYKASKLFETFNRRVMAVVTKLLDESLSEQMKKASDDRSLTLAGIATGTAVKPNFVRADDYEKLKVALRELEGARRLLTVCCELGLPTTLTRTPKITASFSGQSGLYGMVDLVGVAIKNDGVVSLQDPATGAMARSTSFGKELAKALAGPTGATPTEEQFTLIGNMIHELDMAIAQVEASQVPAPKK